MTFAGASLSWQDASLCREAGRAAAYGRRMSASPTLGAKAPSPLLLRSNPPRGRLHCACALAPAQVGLRSARAKRIRSPVGGRVKSVALLPDPPTLARSRGLRRGKGLVTRPSPSHPRHSLTTPSTCAVGSAARNDFVATKSNLGFPLRGKRVRPVSKLLKTGRAWVDTLLSAYQPLPSSFAVGSL